MFNLRHNYAYSWRINHETTQFQPPNKPNFKPKFDLSVFASTCDGRPGFAQPVLAKADLAQADLPKVSFAQIDLFERDPGAASFAEAVSTHADLAEIGVIHLVIPEVGPAEPDDAGTGVAGTGASACHPLDPCHPLDHHHPLDPAPHPPLPNSLLKKSLLLALFALSRSLTAAPTPAPTFAKDIAPIIYQNCSTCHRPGESAPFSLLNYNDIKTHAAQIATVTKQRYMPPWQPEPGHGDFQEERRLTDPQIQLIQSWVKQGAASGNLATAPPPPTFNSEWQLGKPDLILKVAQPYRLAPDGDEIFWNFVMPVPVTTTRWVKAMEVRPGNPKVFHHANVIIDRSGSALRKEPSPGVGFSGMDLTVEEDTFDPDGHFLSWKPGSPPMVEPDGMAWRAEPGMDLVLNVHLRRTGKEEIVTPEIALYFTDQPQTRFPMLVQLEHDGAIDIPAGDKDFVITDEFHCPIDVNVLAVYPHAHYLATLMEAIATLPDGSKKWLVRIPHWDLNWQGVYRLKEPMLLPKGTVVSMSYHYDNSTANVRNPNTPPKRVKGGNQALDEMSHFWLQVLPVESGDQRAVLQEALMHRRLEKYPGDFSANFNLGDLMMNQSNPAAAIPYFRLASEADPNSAVAAGEFGAALFSNGDAPSAEQQFKRALALDPKYIDARYNLASVEANNGQWPDAAADFKHVLDSNPDHKNARQHLGEVLFMWGEELSKSGDRQQAVQRYQDALVVRPDDPDLHAHLGTVLAQLQRVSEARAQFEAALKIDPGSAVAKQALEALKPR